MMAHIERLKGYILTVLVCAILFGGYLVYERSSRPAAMQIIIPTPTVAPTEAPLVVDVVGAVFSPGVYTVAPGSRWQQAIEAAGGMTASADRMRINLADHLVDGQQIVVPAVGETPMPTLTTCQGAVASQEGSGQQVNINVADAAQLDELPCIGPALAERIVAYRQEHGPFAQPSDIMKVSGIGPVSYQKLESLIVVN